MFPNYKKTKKKFLFWEYEIEEKDGWEDLEVTDFEIIGKVFLCNTCGETLRVGKENEKCFRYCEICMLQK